MSIMNFINEENDTTATESTLHDAASLMIITFFLTTFGLSIKQYLDRKKEKEADKKRKKDADEWMVKVKDYLAKHPNLHVENSIMADIRRMVNKAKTSPEIKAKIQESLKHVYDSTDTSYRLVVDDAGDYIEIIDASQDVCSTLGWIIEDMVKVLDVKYKELVDLELVSFGSGDGDEGCIYVDIKDNIK